MLHRHDWHEVDRFYAQPLACIKKISTDEEAAIPMSLFLGQTTIVLRCKKCNKIKTLKILGKSVKGAEDGQ